MNRGRTRWLFVVSAAAIVFSIAGWQVIPSRAEDDGGFRPRRYRPRIASAAPPAAAAEADVLRLGWNADGEADWPAAEVLAAVSEISYHSPEQAQRKFQALGFQKVRAFQVDTLFGYVVSTDDVSVITFRGTDELSEWLVNLETFSHYTPHGSVHEGYYKAYRSLKPQVTRLLTEGEPRKFWITGHSMGGALALVCAYDMITQENLRPHGVMTFGQPMVADRQLANYLDDRLAGRYVHFVNGRDIVPRLPPGYAHCGSLVWFSSGKIVRSPPRRRPLTAEFGDRRAQRQDLIEPLSEEEFADLKADLRRSARTANSNVRRASFSKQSPEWVEDHAMTLYLKRIQSIDE